MPDGAPSSTRMICMPICARSTPPVASRSWFRMCPRVNAGTPPVIACCAPRLGSPKVMTPAPAPCCPKSAPFPLTRLSMPTRSRITRFVDPFEPTQIRRLVAEFGSPLLIIDCERVRVQLHKLAKALPKVDLHYALKPLPHPAVVQVVMQEGGYLDLATTGEVQLVNSLGASPERCIHTHPIKRPQDIRNAMEFGVRTFVADNPDEVRKFARLGERARLLLRVSFRSPGAVCDLSRKFGCDPEHFLELARLAASLGIDVQGASFHVGSQATDPAKHVEAIEACAKLLAAARREKLGTLDTLDIG